MTQLPFFPDAARHHDERPLPLIVAEKWNFPLAYVEIDRKGFPAGVIIDASPQGYFRCRIRV
jgi:hypothetical protein